MRCPASIACFASRLARTPLSLLAIATVLFSDGANRQARAVSFPSNPIWERQNVVPGPAERWGAAMAFDIVAGKTVLFGGINNNGKLGDTWIRQNGIWSMVQPSEAPSARLGAAMVYDAARSNIVLFGGHDSTGRVADTWIWNGALWSRMTPSQAPSPRSFAAMAFDVARGKVVLFGGLKDGGGSAGDT